MTDVNDQFAESPRGVWAQSLNDLIHQAHVAEIPPHEIFAELQYSAIGIQTGFMSAIWNDVNNQPE